MHSCAVTHGMSLTMAVDDVGYIILNYEDVLIYFTGFEDQSGNFQRSLPVAGVMLSAVFGAHGRLCASRPWEVIVSVITLTVWIFSLEATSSKPRRYYKPMEEYWGVDVILMTIIRCSAILFSYHQLRKLQRLKSNFIIGIAGLFVVFSSVVFSSTVMNMLSLNIGDLRDALFFFLLVIDLSKASLLARYALSCNNQTEAVESISRGMAILGPSLTLDTIVETLLMGVGTLSGVGRLEMMSMLACMSVVVNYILFMTFYPAVLSLVLELSGWCPLHKLFHISLDDLPRSNPVVQRVKLIMSGGLLLVHVHSRWGIEETPVTLPSPLHGIEADVVLAGNHTENMHSYVLRAINSSIEQTVLAVMVLFLVIKYIWFEHDQETEELLKDIDLPPETSDKGVNTDIKEDEEVVEEASTEQCLLPRSSRPLEECWSIFTNEEGGGLHLSDEEIVRLVEARKIPMYKLEETLGDPLRGVKCRRVFLAKKLGLSSAGHKAGPLAQLPFDCYDYSRVMNVCCDNVIGYVPVPVGIVGPVKLDGSEYWVPMATTEGCLLASVQRGARAAACGPYQIRSYLLADGMSRAPVIRFPSALKASEAYHWLQKPENMKKLKEEFDSTSRFARLQEVKPRVVGRLVFIRFLATTGDAMGMNMLSKGVEKILMYLQDIFHEMDVLSVSGNFCTDKKAAAVNWIEGRGKSVVCEALVPREVVEKTLKSTVQDLVELNTAKNHVGSALAGAIGGGFNAHAANTVAAIFIATGQDAAQTVVSGNCLTQMENHNGDLYVAVTMPSIEVGTVGGGTRLPAQSAALSVLGIKGAHPETPGQNAAQLSRIICACVLAGELSIMAALAAGHLVKSHLRLNRSQSSVCMRDLDQLQKRPS